MEDRKVIGVDIGGTKVHMGIVQNGVITKELKLTTAAQGAKEQLLSDITDGIRQLMDADVTGIGIGVPGLVDDEKGIVYNVQNIPSWDEVHLKTYLEDAFNRPVCVTNDANTFVLGEKVYGKGKRFKNMLGITLGTGMGTGIIINHGLYGGAFSCAGEFGSVPYLDQTLEDYCSGKFFQNKHGMSGDQLQVLAEEGDAKAIDIFRQFGHHLGNAIKVVLYALSPEAIFLGGSASRSYPFFHEEMHRSIASFPYRVVTDQLVLECSEIENAAVLGAAALWHMGRASMKNSNPTQA
ncbi:ROK family protein [Pontibacter brevis]